VITMNNNMHMLVHSMTQDKPFDDLKFLSEKTNLHSNTHPRYLYKKCSNDKDKVLFAQQEAKHLAAVWRNAAGLAV
jgi:glucose-6-phosphate isomerase